VGPNFTATSVGEVVLKKLLRKLLMVMGAWPAPPQITVRSKPNSRFLVGRKLIFSTCAQGSPGLTTFGVWGTSLQSQELDSDRSKDQAHAEGSLFTGKCSSSQTLPVDHGSVLCRGQRVSPRHVGGSTGIGLRTHRRDLSFIHRDVEATKSR
jgi:hypothetical protein